MAIRVPTWDEAMNPAPATVGAGGWPAQIKHLSPSSIKKFLECPDKWRKHYLLREREVMVGFWLFQGSVNHGAIDWGLKEKMRTGRLPEQKDVLEAFDDLWEKELEDRGGSDSVSWVKSGETHKPGAVKDSTAALVRAYYPIAQTLDPIALEQEFLVPVPGVVVPLTGKIDIELKDRLVDRKDAPSRTRSPKPDWILQGGIYTAVKGKPIDFHVTTKTQKPMVYTPGVDPDLAMPAWSQRRMHLYVQRVYNAIVNLHSTFGPDEVWPGGTMHPFACNYCGLRANCAWWAE